MPSSSLRFSGPAGLSASLLAALLALPAAQAQTAAPVLASSEAQQLAQLRATTLALIDALVSQGLLTRERADAIKRQAEQAGAQAAHTAPVATSAAASAAPEAAKVLRIPYVPESTRLQMREEIKTEVLAQARRERWGEPDALPEWLGRVRVGGDVRARAQKEYMADSNVPAEIFRAQTSSPAWAPDLSNTTLDRQRMTLRARLEVDAKLSDQVQTGLRLSSGGSSSGPTSTSQTLGNQFNRYALGLDRAWLRWQPEWFHNKLAAAFGRMPNPFYSSDLSWPEDMAFDGVAAQLKHSFAPQRSVFASMGAFPLEEFSGSTRDKWLFGGQIGGDISLGGGAQLKLGLAAYEFRHIEGQRESERPPSGPRAGTGAYFSSQYPSSLRLKGNTLINLNDPTSVAAPTWGLASKFRPINVTAGLTLENFASTRLALSMDWIKNTGFSLADIQARAGVSLSDSRDKPNSLLAKTQALQAKAQIGRAALARRGDWQAFAAFRFVERDAWVDGFTDTTWHLGGTNYKGWSLGGSYALDTRFWMNARWTSTRNLDDGVRYLAVPGDAASLSGNLSSAPLRIDVFQLDLNARF